MPTARESFVAEIDAERYEIVAREWVAPDHDVFRKHSDKFNDHDDAQSRARVLAPRPRAAERIGMKRGGTGADGVMARGNDRTARHSGAFARFAARAAASGGGRRVSSGDVAVLVAELRAAGYRAAGAYITPRRSRTNGRTQKKTRQHRLPARSSAQWRLPGRLPDRAPTVELRIATPRLKVRLAPRLRQAICDQARISRDGFEIGGGLFGPRWFDWHPAIEVASVIEPGPDTVRKRGSLKRDLVHRFREREALRRVDETGVEQGDWHTHSTPDGSVPSPDDLRAWLSDLDALQVGAYVGLIVCPDAVRGWSAPQFHAWVMRRRSYTDSPLCERAEVV